jgi:hypothetical protein
MSAGVLDAVPVPDLAATEQAGPIRSRAARHDRLVHPPDDVAVGEPFAGRARRRTQWCLAWRAAGRSRVERAYVAALVLYIVAAYAALAVVLASDGGPSVLSAHQAVSRLATGDEPGRFEWIGTRTPPNPMVGALLVDSDRGFDYLTWSWLLVAIADERVDRGDVARPTQAGPAVGDRDE